MPWEVSDVMEVRTRFVEDWRSGTWSVAELCRFYEVTRLPSQLNSPFLSLEVTFGTSG